MARGLTEPEPQQSRVEAIIAWLRENEREVDAAPKGCLEVHFSGSAVSFNWQRYYERRVKCK